jgi:cell division transport system permease protein
MMSRAKFKKRPIPGSGGIISLTGYFFRRSLLNIRQNLLINVLAVVTITLSFLIVSLFLLVFVNLEGAGEIWSEKVQVTVYFDRELNSKEYVALRNVIMTLQGTDTVGYVSKDEALKRFRARLKGQEALLDGVPSEILPASLEIRLKQAYRTSDAVMAYVARLKKIPTISEVQYGEEWVRRFNTFMNFMRFAGALLGGFIALAVLFIISNTIKITIYSRREEVELLELVGATRFFIKVPFLIEGILQGVCGALLALLILAGVSWAFLNHAGNFMLFNPSLSSRQVFSSVLWGVSRPCTGSSTSHDPGSLAAFPVFPCSAGGGVRC